MYLSGFKIREIMFFLASEPSLLRPMKSTNISKTSCARANGLLRPSSEKNLYTTTEEGMDFLEQYRKLNGPLMKKVGMGRTMWRQ